MTLNLEGRGKVLGLGHGQGPGGHRPSHSGAGMGIESRQFHTAVAPVGLLMTYSDLSALRHLVANLWPAATTVWVGGYGLFRGLQGPAASSNGKEAALTSPGEGILRKGGCLGVDGGGGSPTAFVGKLQWTGPLLLAKYHWHQDSIPFPWEMGLACMLVHRPAAEAKGSWVGADLNLNFFFSGK